MKRTKKLKLYGIITISLFWISLFGSLSGTLPSYTAYIFAGLLVVSSILFIMETDKVVNHHLDTKDLPSLDLPSQEEENPAHLDAKIKKGSFVLQKNLFTLLEKKMVSKEEIEEGFSTLTDNLSSLNEAFLKSMKASIKYDRSNALQIIDVIQKSSSKKGASKEAEIVELLTRIATGLEEQKSFFTNLEDQLASLPSRQTSLSSSEVLPPVTPTFASESQLVEEPETLELEPALSSEEISEFNSVSEEPEMEVIPNPEPIPEPEPQPVDPNKPLSPEEIAALIANLGD